jgi:hypothetical protein
MEAAINPVTLTTPDQYNDLFKQMKYKFNLLQSIAGMTKTKYGELMAFPYVDLPRSDVEDLRFGSRVILGGSNLIDGYRNMPKPLLVYSNHCFLSGFLQEEIVLSDPEGRTMSVTVMSEPKSSGMVNSVGQIMLNLPGAIHGFPIGFEARLRNDGNITQKPVDLRGLTPEFVRQSAVSLMSLEWLLEPKEVE